MPGDVLAFHESIAFAVKQGGTAPLISLMISGVPDRLDPVGDARFAYRALLYEGCCSRSIDKRQKFLTDVSKVS